MPHLRPVRVCVVALCVAAPMARGVADEAAAPLRVRLTAHERGGVERLAEPITTGVPFPPGALREEDVGRLGIVDAAGRPVPAQFSIANRWWNHPGKPVRWVHASFAPSVPANGRTEYFVVTNPAAARPVAPLRIAVETNAASKTIEKVTLVTGPLKFTVRRARFNVIDEAWLDESGGGRFDEPARMIAPHAGGAVVFSSLNGGASNTTYRASQDDGGTLEIEEAGPLRVTLKLTGKHVSRDGQSGPGRMLDYICRISAFAGSPLVKVQHVFACRQGASVDEGLPVDGMYIELPLSVRGKAYALGKPKGMARGPLPPGGRAWCLADASDHYEFGGAARDAGSGHTKRCLPMKVRWASDKPGAKGQPAPGETAPEYGDPPDGIGWVDVSDGTRGVAAGVKWFWELWPKAVEARSTPAGSALRLHLWANVDEKVLPVPAGWSPTRDSIVSRAVRGRANVFPGMAKTHEMYFLFHGAADDGILERAWNGLSQPVRAICDPAWYCEKSRAWDMIPSSSPGLYKPEDFTIVRNYDRRIAAWCEFIERYRGKEFDGLDSFGIFHFGNNINFVRNRTGTTPLDILWDNHYYDYPHAVFMQFARTGDLDLLDRALEADVNLTDVAMCCWHPDPELIGCSRYSPSADMIRRDSPPHDVFTPEVYSWHRVNFDRWWLLGDRHAFDMNVLYADFVRRHSKVLNACDMNLGHGMRSRGHLLANLSKGYIATGDMSFLSAAKRIYYGPVGYRGAEWKPDYQYGIWVEGIYQFHLASGDRRPLRSISANVNNEINGVGPFAFGIAALRSEAPELQKMVRDKYAELPGVKMMWGAVQDFGLQLRSAPYGLWALTDPEILPHFENPPDVLKDIPPDDAAGVAPTAPAADTPAVPWQQSDDAVPGLVALLDSPAPAIRQSAAKLLGEMGARAAAALPRLKELQARDASEPVRKAASEAVEKIARAGAGTLK